jgi:prepilin signal peptidase PulO-like enzyme (type II secretory pathway)
MAVIAVVGKMIYKKDAMGGGDIKLTALLGMMLGWKELLLVLLITFLMIAVVGWVGIGLRRIKRSSEIPMAPFFAAAVIGSIFLGSEILHWYFHQVGIH